MKGGGDRIVAATPTDRGVDDASQVAPLLDQVAEPEAFLKVAGAISRHARHAAIRRMSPVYFINLAVIRISSPWRLHHHLLLARYIFDTQCSVHSWY